MIKIGYADTRPRWGVSTEHAVRPETERKARFGSRGTPTAA
jgi:hypothetical protein